MKVFITDGVAGTTFTMTGSDVPQALAAIKLTDANSRKIKAALIEVDIKTGFNIRYAYTAVPAANTYHYLSAGSAIAVVGYPNLEALTFVDDVSGSHAVLWITPYY